MRDETTQSPAAVAFERSQAEGSSEPAATEPQTFTMTEDQLKRILQDARGGGLPPTAFYDEEGRCWRKVPHPTGRIKNGQMIYQWRLRPVLITADTTPSGIRKAQQQARLQEQDFYKPGVGWLRFGWAKEVDAPENLGIGNERFEEYEVPLSVSDAEPGSTTVTVPGRSLEEPDNAAEREAAKAEAVQSRRRRGGA